MASQILEYRGAMVPWLHMFRRACYFKPYLDTLLIRVHLFIKCSLPFALLCFVDVVALQKVRDRADNFEVQQ